MWIFLSSRLRTWLLLAVALPLARTVIRRAAARIGRRNPDSPAASWLQSADSALTRRTRRRR
jgi:hypothetical protein